VPQLNVDVAGLKNGRRWVKRLLMVMATTLVMAMTYIFT
jgi:hypothetical protein